MSVTSRGDSEEHWYAVKHALHTEGHLEEMISQAAAAGNRYQLINLVKILDVTRMQRQRLVQQAFIFEQRIHRRPGAMPALKMYWCSIKHVLLLEGHLEELIANAARHRDIRAIQKLGKELNHTMQKRRELIICVIRSAGTKSSQGCIRCAGDLITKAVNKLGGS